MNKENGIVITFQVDVFVGMDSMVDFKVITDNLKKVGYQVTLTDAYLKEIDDSEPKE